LIKVRTVNLSQLAVVFSGSAKISSNYKRLQRFLRHFDWELDWGATVIAQLFCPNDPWILSVDRTNWQFGKLDINFLVLGVLFIEIFAFLCFGFYYQKKVTRTHKSELL